MSMLLCPNCRRLEADPATVHNRGRLVPKRNAPGESSSSSESRLYTCRHCGALWNLDVIARTPWLPRPAERWSLRQSPTPRPSA